MKKLFFLGMAVLFCSAGFAANKSSEALSAADETVVVELYILDDWRFAAGADQCGKQVYFEYHNGTSQVYEAQGSNSLHHLRVKKGTVLLIHLRYQASGRAISMTTEGFSENRDMEFPDPMYWEIRQYVTNHMTATVNIRVIE